MQNIVEIYDPAVYGRAYHAVADGRVYAVGKVYGRSARRKVYNIALGRKYEHLVGEHVYLEVVEKVRRVRLLLALQQPPYPCEFFLVALLDDCLRRRAYLVLPVRRNAVFSRAVHFPCAYLHLEGYALGAYDRRVDALVHIRLGSGDIILESARHGLEHIVDDAQYVIAVGDRIDDDAECAQVKYTIDIELLRVHFSVNAINMLYTAVDRDLKPLVLKALFYLFLDRGHEASERIHAVVQGVGYLLIARRIEVHQRQILQLPLGSLHTEPVRDGGVYLHRLQRLLPLLFLGLICHRAHIVQAVGYLYENDADVLGHCHEHLAQILHLLVFLAGVLHPRELCNALDDIRDRFAELLCNVAVGKIGVLYNVVQERCDYRILVKPHVGGYVRRRDTVGDVGRAVPAQLAGVREPCHAVGRVYPAHVHIHAAVRYLFTQCGKHLVGIKFSVFCV